ncbi:PDZ-binding protein, partial [Syncephalis pseudoplumigaleata]
EKKLATVVCPEVWKEGSRNGKAQDRKLNENKLLSKSKNRLIPYEKKCRLCKSRVHQEKAHYCQGAGTWLTKATGICAMCGVRILDVSGYKQSSK